MTHDDKPREKKWSDLYLRSEKRHRAKQLGIPYPRKSPADSLSESSVNVLFVCSKNKWRSPTAERVFSSDPMLFVRSRGTARAAVRTISSGDLKWADLIFAMEQKHKQRLVTTYPGELKFKDIFVLDIPDDYKYMDSDLIEILRESVAPIIEAYNA